MLGFSDEDTPTPFILLSNGECVAVSVFRPAPTMTVGLVKTKTPEAIVQETLRTASLATCMELMLRFVSMIISCVDAHCSFLASIATLL